MVNGQESIADFGDWNGSTPSPTPIPTDTPTATPTSTATASRTPTATPPGDVTLSGLVYDAVNGAQHPIPNAIVAVTVCVPRSFSTTAERDGGYASFLPAAYLYGCEQVTLSDRPVDIGPQRDGSHG